MKKALVLSGGGARCIAQIGYAQCLKENGIEFDCFSGSSGGAVVSAFLAKGYEPKEIFEIIKCINFKKYMKLNLFRGSIFHLDKFYPLFKKYGLDDFKNLKHELHIAVTDYENYETKYINSGDLAKYLIASSSLIPIFAPTKIDGRYYVDGGFTDNLPVAPCLKSDFILAINVNPIMRFKNTFFGNLHSAAYILLNNNIKYSKDRASKYTEIKECGNYSILTMKNFDKIYEAGFKKAKKDIDSLKRKCNV